MKTSASTRSAARARWRLRSMLLPCDGVKIEDTKQVALGSGPGPALIAGRLKCAVLHLDDLAAIEAQGKKLNVMVAMKNTDPNSHYLSLMVRKDTLAAKRDAMVKTVAAMIDASKFMQDPKNADAVADAATITGHNKEIAKAALGISRGRFLGGEGRRPAEGQDRSGFCPHEEDRRDQAGQGSGDLRQVRRHLDLERRQRDGEVVADWRRAGPRDHQRPVVPAKAGTRPGSSIPHGRVTGSPAFAGDDTRVR